jgi:ascorbate PTS system EIIA or EIIAB component
MLSDYLTADTIRLNVEVDSWQAAVRAAGDLLVQASKCTPAYVEAMIAAVDELGPYMVLAPGLALAHARPESGMLSMGLSLVSLATPVEFGSVDNDPVVLVIGFGGTDSHSHIHMLSSLASFLGEDSNQELLKRARSIEEVLAAIQGY